MTSEDWEDLADLSDLWSGYISDSIIIYCDDWLYKVLINPIQNSLLLLVTEP
jgi:hypothetical protein